MNCIPRDGVHGYMPMRGANCLHGALIALSADARYAIDGNSGSDMHSTRVYRRPRGAELARVRVPSRFFGSGSNPAIPTNLLSKTADSQKLGIGRSHIGVTPGGVSQHAQTRSGLCPRPKTWFDLAISPLVTGKPSQSTKETQVLIATLENNEDPHGLWLRGVESYFTNKESGEAAVMRLTIPWHYVLAVGLVKQGVKLPVGFTDATVLTAP